MNPFKNWKTSVAAILGALLMVVGIFFPDQVDPDTQLVVQAAAGEIMSGVGAIIAVLSGIFGKDPE